MVCADGEDVGHGSQAVHDRPEFLERREENVQLFFVVGGTEKKER